MISLPAAFRSTSPTFFQIFTASAPLATSCASFASTLSAQPGVPKPFIENVVAQWKCAGSFAASASAIVCCCAMLGKSG